jgi:hypothetical protein
MPILLVALAGVALAWPYIHAHWHEWRIPKLDSRHLAAAALVAAAAWSYVASSPATPQPAPAPAPDPSAFTLRGKFVGPQAARDAALVAALCSELADEIEWDAQQPEPLIRTGVAFDELRVRSRILLCRGESLGDRHPLARQAIEDYLNTVAGTSGGPLTDEAKAAWVAAYRDVARAAEAAR